MKAEDTALFNYKIVYSPKYIRKSGVKTSNKLDDVPAFLEELMLFMRGRVSKLYAKSPMLFISRFDKHKYEGLVIRLINANTKKADVEFMAVYYDDLDKNANPYAMIVNDKFNLRDDIDRGLEVIKTCVGHYYYSGASLKNHNYFLDEKHEPNKKKPDIDFISKMLIGSRDIAITKYDLFNEYLKTLDPDVAYSRMKQRDMLKLIERRFGIKPYDSKTKKQNDEDSLANPSYYLGKAMEYTDYKLMAVVSQSQDWKTASPWHGYRVIVPRDESEKKDFFKEIAKKMKKVVDEQ